MSFFTERKNIRFRDGTLKLIDEYINNNPGRWENTSHFVRCALEREFRRLRAEGIFGGEKQ